MLSWLRKERDFIGLVVVWTILLQSIVLPFSAGLHAATLMPGPGEGNILCTSRGTAVSPELPGQSHKKPDCQCCHMSCRQGCGSALGGILPDSAREPLPSSIVLAIAGPRRDAPAPRAARHAAAQPRAPPLA